MPIWATLLILAAPSIAAPAVFLPVNAQVPPVAIIDQAYQFVFSESTLISTAGVITYSLGDCPPWLKLDSQSRTLYGTPESQSGGLGEDGAFTVDLVATDAKGATIMPVTLIVTTNPGPKVGTPLATQLPAFGAFSGPDTLLLTPGTILSLTFSPKTFLDTDVHTLYYSLCTNGTPLPSWITFNPNSLSFSGTTPHATSPSELPQTLCIQLVASQVTGFAQASMSFKLVTVSHIFTFGNNLQIINTTFGSLVNFTSLRDDLALDGQQAQRSDIVHVVSDTPSWLSLDNSTLILTGQTPANALQQNFTVTATDRFGDSASTEVLIQLAERSSATLIRPIPPFNATIDTNLTYELDSSTFLTNDINVTMDPGTASAWLEFDPSSRKLYGHVPSNLKPQTVQLNVSATRGIQNQFEIVDMDLICGNVACLKASIYGDVPRTTADGGFKPSTGGLTSKNWIAAAVILPLAALTGICILWWCCCRAQKDSKLSVNHKRKRKFMISRPVEQEKQETHNLQVGQIWHRTRNHERLLSEAPESPRTPRAQHSMIRRISQLLMPTKNVETADKSTRPDSWDIYIRNLPSLPPNDAEAMSRLDRTHGDQASPTAEVWSETSRSTNTLPPAIPVQSLSQCKNPKSKARRRGLMMLSHRSNSGFGHGQSGPSEDSSSVFCANKGIGHGGGFTTQGPMNWGLIRNSWRNLSRLSWTSTQSSPNDSDQVVEEVAERPHTQKTSPSILESFPRPPAAVAIDAFPRSHVIPEATADEEADLAITKPLPLKTPRIKGKPSFRKKGIEGLEKYHKYRAQQGSQNPWFSAHLSSSRKSSTKTDPNSIEYPDPGDVPDDFILSSRRIIPRSYSRSSLAPQTHKSSSEQSNQSNSSKGTKSRRNLNFATRTRSFRRSHSSYASTTSSSKRSDTVSGSSFYHHGALREVTDEEGNKQWRHPNHPNPLRINKTSNVRQSTDVNDVELIESLRSADQLSAAQRLSYLQARTEAVGGEEPEVETAIELRSARGRKLDHRSAVRNGNLGNKSMKGDIGDVGRSTAFI